MNDGNYNNTHHPGYARVAGIDPVDGWVLLSVLETDGDGFPFETFFAGRDGEVRLLNLCRFRFTPAQERFAWLVAAGFPSRVGHVASSWDDADIDAMIALERTAA